MNRDRIETPLKAPAGTDRDWQTKIEKAQQAREMGQELRAGKDSSFRRAVGKVQGRVA